MEGRGGVKLTVKRPDNQTWPFLSLLKVWTGAACVSRGPDVAWDATRVVDETAVRPVSQF